MTPRSFTICPNGWRNGIPTPRSSCHPLAEYYRSDKPDMLAQQLRWKRRAGIDSIVYERDVYERDERD